MMKRCPTCGASGSDEDVFCEADGARLLAEGATAQATTEPAAKPGPGSACASCGEPNADGGDGYCSSCGMRLGPPEPAEVAADDASRLLDELALFELPHDPSTAAACHPGIRRDHNEDAVAVAGGAGPAGAWSVMVVCDGVSSSKGAGRASTTAAKSARDALAHFARSPDAEFEAVAGAVAAVVRAAHVAVCAEARDMLADGGPGTTIVAALVQGGRLTVGWVGDSRAYWVGAVEAELLTRDHSWMVEAVARGEMTEAEAELDPMAHAITRCLGPLEVGASLDLVDPDVKVRELHGPGYVVLCTDGLWNYYSKAPDLAALVRAAGPDATPAAIARALVGHALARGGGDNIGVAVHAYHPLPRE